MNPKILLADLNKGFPEYRFEYHTQGGGWSRAFISIGGISIGRINFSPSPKEVGEYEVYGTHPYKHSEWEYEERDDIFYLWSFYLETGIRPQISDLVPIAKEARKVRIQKVLEWRAQNPTRTRINIHGVEVQNRRATPSECWMGEFYRLVEQRLQELRQTQ